MIKTGRKGNVKMTVVTAGASAWATATQYAVGDIVSNGTPVKYYMCKTEHESAAEFSGAELENWVEVTNGVAVSKMSSWKLTIKQNLVDSSHFGEGGWDSSVPGTKNWDGSIEGSWNVADDPLGQKVIQDAVGSGAEIDLELFIDEEIPDEMYAGKAYIEEVGVDTATKDLVKISVKFKGNGALIMP